MDSKNRLLIVIIIISLIAVAMLTSFGRNLFGAGIPSVILPDTSSASSSSGSTSGNISITPPVTQVEVTPKTVQNVIASLMRSDSYYREISVDLFWDGGSNTTPATVWHSDGWTKVMQTLPSGQVRYDLVGDETVYYWYEGADTWLSTPADDASPDLATRIPTYETVLDLDPADIVAAGYQSHQTLGCIYVALAEDEWGYLHEYWIDVDSGLLVGAQSTLNGEITYLMRGYTALHTPCPDDISFDLPDGTVVIED